MASVSAHVPVAVILLVGGLLSCFLGYRLLRLLVAVYGFGLGVIIVTAFADRLEPWVMVAVMAGGGLLGALLAKAAYLAVVAVLGAGLGALVVRAGGLSGADEPGLWVMLSVCLAGALVALALRKYVVIIGTSFGGAWTALVGGLALAGDSAAVAAASGDVQQVYPLAPASTQMEFAVAWYVLAGVALLVQLRTGRRRPWL